MLESPDNRQLGEKILLWAAKNSSSQSSESKPGTGNTQRDQVFFQQAAFHCCNGFQWLLSICLRPQQWSLTNDNTNHVSKAAGWMEMWLWDVAGALDGTPSHASLICVWFLNLPPGYCPISSFSLHFIKKKQKKGENILNFSNCLIYLECQIFGKKSLTTGLMDHGAAFLAGGHRNNMRAKEIRGRKAKGKFPCCARLQHLPLGSRADSPAAGKKLPWKEKWVSNTEGIKWQHLIYWKEDVFAF